MSNHWENNPFKMSAKLTEELKWCTEKMFNMKQNSKRSTED